MCVWMRVWVNNSFFSLFRIFQVLWPVATPCEGEVLHPSGGKILFRVKHLSTPVFGIVTRFETFHNWVAHVEGAIFNIIVNYHLQVPDIPGARLSIFLFYMWCPNLFPLQNLTWLASVNLLRIHNYGLLKPVALILWSVDPDNKVLKCFRGLRVKRLSHKFICFLVFANQVISKDPPLCKM